MQLKDTVNKDFLPGLRVEGMGPIAFSLSELTWSYDKQMTILLPLGT